MSAHSADTRSAVQNALNAGLEVTIHEKPVTVSGWTGAGYTMIDPGTGAGGYIIEGGSNGGALFGLLIGLLVGVAVIVAGPIVAGLAGAAAFILSQYFSYIGEGLDFSVTRYLGTLAGIVLAIILGGYVVVSFTPLFVIGMIYLMLNILRLIVVEILSKAEGIFPTRQYA